MKSLILSTVNPLDFRNSQKNFLDYFCEILDFHPLLRKKLSGFVKIKREKGVNFKN